jgi:hypothetical protein
MYSEYLADRIRLILDKKKVSFGENKMMGGIAFMVNEKMCVGVLNDDLMARVGVDVYEEALTRKGARVMDFTKRPMKGWIFVGPEGIDSEDDLESWIQLALDFNPRAESSKKR